MKNLDREYSLKLPNTKKLMTKKTGRPRSGKSCSCGQKHYAKGMCKTCYMVDYNKGWGR